jgi:hypothetical protein
MRETAVHPHFFQGKSLPPCATLQRNHGFDRTEIEGLAHEFPHVLRMEIERTGEAGRPTMMVELNTPDAKARME